jgi:hypothetical protein
MFTGDFVPGIFPRMIMMVSQQNYIGNPMVLKYFSSLHYIDNYLKIL